MAIPAMVAGLALAAPPVTPTASPTVTPTPTASVSPVVSQASTAWLPTLAQFWLVVIFFVLVTAVWVGLVTYNQLASGRTLKRTQEVLGLRPIRRALQQQTSRQVADLTVQELDLLKRATRAATMRGTPLTRQLLALLTFSLIAGLVLVIFTENGADDLRKQTATALLLPSHHRVASTSAATPPSAAASRARQRPQGQARTTTSPRLVTTTTRRQIPPRSRSLVRASSTGPAASPRPGRRPSPDSPRVAGRR
jgi:hypothetical protein